MNIDELKARLKYAYSVQKLNSLRKISETEEAKKLIQSRENLITQKTAEWEIIKYAETEEEVKSIIEGLKPEHYAYILHDKDVKENGEAKEEHYHILCIFTKKVNGGNVLKIADLYGDNTRIDPIKDVYGAYQYLLHEDKDGKPLPKKHHYKDEERKCDNGVWWLDQKQISDGIDNATQCLEDILAGKYTTRQLCRKYGRDYIINRDKYELTASIIAYEEKLQFVTSQQRIKEAERLTNNELLLIAYRTPIQFRTEEMQYMIDHDKTNMINIEEAEKIFKGEK